MHGGTEEHTIWIRKTSIERYVDGKNVCIIMPAVDWSFFADMVHGNNYFTYLTEELPDLIHDIFNTSVACEDNYVAGVSMGGYGAFKLALNYPDRYSKVASIFGSLDLKAMYDYTLENDKHTANRLDYAFGNVSNF